jgi:uncharacterized membrane protein YjfL (UPF0719 family)
MDLINPQAIVSSLLYSMIGIFIFWIAFLIIDKLTPAYDLWHEIVRERNLPLAILVASMCLGLAIIVAAAIHG